MAKVRGREGEGDVSLYVLNLRTVPPYIIRALHFGISGRGLRHLTVMYIQARSLRRKLVYTLDGKIPLAAEATLHREVWYDG